MYWTIISNVSAPGTIDEDINVFTIQADSEKEAIEVFLLLKDWVAVSNIGSLIYEQIDDFGKKEQKEIKSWEDFDYDPDQVNQVRAFVKKHKTMLVDMFLVLPYSRFLIKETKIYKLASSSSKL